MKYHYVFSKNDLAYIRDALSEYIRLLYEMYYSETSIGNIKAGKCYLRDKAEITKLFERFATVEYYFDSAREACIFSAGKGDLTIGEMNELIHALKQEIKHLKQSVKDIELLSDNQLFEINRLKKENDRLNKQLENTAHSEEVKK